MCNKRSTTLRKSPATVRAYQADLAAFAAWLGADSPQVGLARLLALDTGQAHALALRWLGEMESAGLAPKTRNRRLTALKSITALARMSGLITWRLELKGDKTALIRDTKGPGTEGVRAMLDAIDGSPLVAARATLIVRLLYSMALRRGEICELHIRDYNRAARTLSVLGKGKSERETLTVPSIVAQALDTYLALRGPVAACEPLLVNFDHANKSAAGLSGRSVARIIDDLAVAAGLGHSHPHGLRHAAITEALDQTNGDVRSVAAFSRHANLLTLVFYDDRRRDAGGKIAQGLDEAL